jgi:hypothetical protein
MAVIDATAFSAGRSPRLEYRQVFQKGDDPDDDDDDLRNLLGARIDRQPCDEIEYEKYDEERYENTDDE